MGLAVAGGILLALTTDLLRQGKTAGRKSQIDMLVLSVLVSLSGFMDINGAAAIGMYLTLFGGSHGSWGRGMAAEHVEGQPRSRRGSSRLDPRRADWLKQLRPSAANRRGGRVPVSSRVGLGVLPEEAQPSRDGSPMRPRTPCGKSVALARSDGPSA